MRTGLIDRRRESIWNRRALGAVILGSALSAGFYYSVCQIHNNEKAHPAVHMLLPLAGIVWIASMLPLLMFLADQDKFKRLNPIVPEHYLKVIKVAYAALIEGSGKVSSDKDY